MRIDFSDFLSGFENVCPTLGRREKKKVSFDCFMSILAFIKEKFFNYTATVLKCGF